VKSLNRVFAEPAGMPVLADDVIEFHAARLLLLFRLCGKAGRIDGLTKMAKLDFFVRYPAFFKALCVRLGKTTGAPEVGRVESQMVRHHYGPWDKRYYQILAYLESRGLLQVTPQGSTYVLSLSEEGKRIAKQLEKAPSYQPIAAMMREVKEVLGDRTGSALKNLIYQTFDSEVARQSLGTIIR